MYDWVFWKKLNLWTMQRKMVAFIFNGNVYSLGCTDSAD